jgi:hypothetical protein
MILVLIVFPGLGNLASIILRFRLKVPETGTFTRNQLKYIRECSSDRTLVLIVN